MKFFTLLLALAIVAFSTFVAATPANQEKSGRLSKAPSANDNQKRDGASTSIWKRGDEVSRVGETKDNKNKRSLAERQSSDEISRVGETKNNKNKRSLTERQSKCPYGYHWCNDAYGGCCPNNTICSANYKCIIHC
ncbi:hypothetical protein C1646_663067 [Rhizophagus diaphanus]|nr:hypothetical protein C1646_663067 [Rhizophagus diaphanus] [Rhizophagus sp. MUCL 43196]